MNLMNEKQLKIQGLKKHRSCISRGVGTIFFWLTMNRVNIYFTGRLVFDVSNGHSRQIRQNGELLVRMCRMRVSFWRMPANVSSIECIEYGEKGWRMSVECSESGLSRVANLANLANF